MTKNNEFTMIDKVIHEPARLMILSYLFVLDSADFVFLMKKTGLTRGNLSSHLSKLENAKYIEIKKEFIDKIPRTMLSISATGKEKFILYKEKMIELLEVTDK